jgi:L-methionine (R)-S-oxide reductase
VNSFNVLKLNITRHGSRKVLQRARHGGWYEVVHCEKEVSEVSIDHTRKNMTPTHKELLRDFQDFAQRAATAKSLMERIAHRLHEKMTLYNWVGFYLADPADPGALLVGPYAGSFTPHARIPLNTGLCGAAASSGQIVVVQDVTKDPRYLAGSPLVKSEIVVPIFVNKKLAAELDIDSYFAGTFNKTEQNFVEACAQVVANYLAKA